MDTFPIPARSPERYFKIDGRNLERCYKEHLSGFRGWNQLEHASDWILLPRKRGEKRGRPRLRSNEKFKPSVLPNGDTKVELLTRAKYILPKSGEKWSESQKKRAGLLFGLKPRIKEAHSLVCQVRCIFKNKNLTKEQAREKLRTWYKNVSESKIREVISARDCIKSKEEQVLNYFDYYSTNAAAESLNSKMKGFRAELRGVRDLPFYMYRCSMIFG